MAVTRSFAILLVFHGTGSICSYEAVCNYDSRHDVHQNESEGPEGCSVSMLQVDTKRQEHSYVMSQQQRAEVNSAMFDLHATLRAHPKVAKQALHEVLLDMQSQHKAAKSGHSIVPAMMYHPQAQPPVVDQRLPLPALLLKERGFQNPATAAHKETAPETRGTAPTPAPPRVAAKDSPEAPEEPEVKGAAQISPFGKEDTASELTAHAERTQDTLVDAVENAEVAEVKRAVFRALTRLRAASIKEFDTIARLETQAIDEYNDAHHYRVENPLTYIHSSEPKVKEDKYTSFH